MLIGALASGVWYERDNLGRLWTALSDRIHNVEPANPTSVTSPNHARGHSPKRLMNGVNDDYWAPRATGDAFGEYVEFTFNSPINLRYVNVAIGVSPEQDKFLKQARPSSLQVRLQPERGTVRVKNVVLKDKAGPQRVDLSYDDIVAVRFVVTSAEGVRPGRRVAIAEVEFFKQS